MFRNLRTLGIAAVAALGLMATLGASGAAERPSGKKVFMASGHDAVSELKAEAFRNVFKSIFSDQALTISTETSGSEFLNGFVSSDIVYVNVHSNPGVMVAGNGDRLTVPDFANAYQAQGNGPALAIVTGCKTIDVTRAESFPDAIGIGGGSTKRAFIGFKTVVFGAVSDRYFRVFLAHWMKPKDDGSYRTLVEARDDARAFIIHILDLTKPNNDFSPSELVFGGPTAKPGPLMKFSMLEANIANQFEIVGDASLRLTDLAAATPQNIGHSHDASGQDMPFGSSANGAITGGQPVGGSSGGGFQGSIGAIGSGGSTPQPQSGGSNANDANQFLRQ